MQVAILGFYSNKKTVTPIYKVQLRHQQKH